MPDIYINDRAQLLAALSTAVGGETFVLAPGNYGDIGLQYRNFSSAVTIRSADLGNLAHVDTFWINQSSNITVRDLDIGRGLRAGEPEYTQMIFIGSSSGITFDSVRVHGSLDRNPGNDGWGWLVQKSSNFSIVNSNIQEFARSFVIEQTNNVRIANNEIHMIRSDGGDFAAVSNVVIENNRYRDFSPNTGDHPDAIQFWTTGQTRGSENVVIRNNVILQGRGVGIQGIFIADENGNTPHRNFVVDNNLLYSGTQWEGIVANGIHGLQLTNNSVLSTTTDDKRYWIRVNNSTGVTLERNITDQLLIESSSLNSNKDNVSFYSDPSKLALLPNINAGVGATVGDLITGYYGYHAPGSSTPAPAPAPAPSPAPAPAPTPAPAPAPAPAPTGKTYYGTAGNDTIAGGAGNDRIFGVGQWDKLPGRGSIDRLSGGAGRDIFVLGDERGVFYDDGRLWRAGRSDYAQILDFKPGTDKVQLAGSFGDYVFRTSTINGLKGLEILRDVNHNDRTDSRDELIGHIVGVTTVNPEHFVFA